MLKQVLFFFTLLVMQAGFYAAAQQKMGTASLSSGQTRLSPSLYSDFSNQNGQGTDEHKILADLGFFKWMHDTYGMKLDYFLIDEDIIDIHAVSGKSGYGTLNSASFLRHFPSKFKDINELAGSFDCRLGLTIGPDGYGNSAKDAAKRIRLMADLCREYAISLVRLDGDISKLRPEKEDYLEQSIIKAKAVNPDLLVIEGGIDPHSRLNRYMIMPEGQEQTGYTDLTDLNQQTGIHHRLGSMSGIPDPLAAGLKDNRGTGLSSVLDFWDDDLVLQAFNKNSFFAPEIFGNPWLLKDEELPRLARIFNVHERFNIILSNMKVLPADLYGTGAVSRGDDETRLVSLRNLSWLPRKFRIRVDSSIGIRADGSFMVKQLFPDEKYIGRIIQGGTAEVTVDPFHSALFLVSLHSADIDLRGCDYELVQAVPGNPIIVKLLGLHGQKVKLIWGGSEYPVTQALLAGKSKPTFFRKGLTFKFPGSKSASDYYHKIGNLSAYTLKPEEAAGVYESACYAADNNAPELRSLARAGISQIREVNLARNALILDSSFTSRGAWDKYAFDGERNTFFKTAKTLHKVDISGAFRLDLGRTESVDQLVLESVNTEYAPGQAEISSDLLHWSQVPVKKEPARLVIDFPVNSSFRYLRINSAPAQVAEIRAFHNGVQLGRASWKASNQFKPYSAHKGREAWKYSFKLRKAADNTFLALSVPGNYARESVYAGLRVNGHLVGAVDRSPSFPCNNWNESGAGTGNYTFYFPVNRSMLRKKLDLILVNSDPDTEKLSAEVWMAAYPVPYLQKILTLR